MHSVKRRKSSVNEDTGSSSSSSSSSITHFRSSIKTNHKSHIFSKQHLNKPVSNPFTNSNSNSNSLNSNSKSFSLDKLPPNVLDLILSQLQTVDLISLSETNKKLNDLAQPHIFNSIHITIPTKLQDDEEDEVAYDENTNNTQFIKTVPLINLHHPNVSIKSQIVASSEHIDTT
ncbi:unnamed protein product [Ambrosiozyma monospora]|uniref:Unnamed protein product n=1 Tax=Ambrosiozyma monospora TaxID=43982 RepID=A0A9W7DPJ8_AMBMO|nr:unnamed protein product [Ambrosiozyma monospora]